MIELNRKVAPQAEVLQRIKIQEAEHFELDNGIPVYYVNAGSQDVLRLEVLFNAGKVNESQRGIANFTNQMLREGTKRKLGVEIIEEIDSFGAFLSLDASITQSSITLYTLRKHLSAVIPVIKELIYESSFPAQELEIIQNQTIQSLKVQLEKTNYVAKINFLESMYGKDHPYGSSSTIDMVKKIRVEDLIDFHKVYYQPDNCFILISGKVGDSELKTLNEIFGKESFPKLNFKIPDYSLDTFNPEKRNLKIKGSVQATIRIGKRTFNRNHPDYSKLIVLNTIFGGYFGSRLMSNIREDKGYTYGISSSFSSHLHSGHFSISTEVNGDKVGEVISEIYKEMDIMQSHLVPEEELRRVKNFISGSFLASLDSPFSLAEKFLTLHNHGLGYDHYYNLLRDINETTPEEIMGLAKQYFVKESFSEIVVD